MEETNKIIEQARRDATSLVAGWKVIYNHRGEGDFDFKVNNPYASFVVHDPTTGMTTLLRADEFGNYLAGFSAQHMGGTGGLFAMLGMGIVLNGWDAAFNDATFDWDAFEPA